MGASPDFEKLLAFMEKLPAIDLPAGRKSIGRGTSENGNWWVKFTLNTKHDLAWRHVQEMGFVLNYVSVEQRLPTVFMPVSPPPYLNGGEEFCLGSLNRKIPHLHPTNAQSGSKDDYRAQLMTRRNGKWMMTKRANPQA